MKTYSHHVFHLIQSLTPSEKKYFKRFCKAHSTDSKSSYELLFDIINSQKEYDEELAIEKLKKQGIGVTFKTLKFNLEQLIFRSLTSLSHDKLPREKVKSGLAEIDFSFDKGLFGLAKQKHKKLKKYCLEIEDFHGLMRLCDLEQKINPSLFQEDDEAADRLFNEMRKYSKQYINYWDYTDLYTAVLRVGRNSTTEAENLSEESKKKLKLIVENQLLSSEKQAISFKSQIMFHAILAQVSHLKGDDQGLFINSKKAIELIESRPDLMTTRNLFFALFNHLSVCNAIGNLSEFSVYRKKILSLMKGDEQLESYKIIVQRYQLEILVFSGFFDELISHKDEFHASIENEKERLYTALIMDPALIYLAVAHYGIGDFKSAARYLSRMFQVSSDEFSSNDFYLGFEARLLHIVMSIESKDYDLLESQLRSLSRWVKEVKRENPVSGLIVKTLNNLLKATSKEEMRYYIELDKQFTKIISKPTLPSFKYFYFDRWVKSKIESKSFAQINKEIGKQVELKLTDVID